MRLLVTRSEPDGERTAAALRAKGHTVMLAPLLRVETTMQSDIDVGRFSAVVMTSVNAARAIRHHPQGAKLAALPAFVVGQRTAEAAREAGFASVTSADGDASDLKRLLVGKPGPFLYPAGEERSDDFAGLPVTIVAVYRAIAAIAFPEAVRAALVRGEIDGVLHFSRRSAVAFVNCAQAAGLPGAALAATHYCLSRQVADPLEAAGATNLMIAARPDEAAMLDLIDKH